MIGSGLGSDAIPAGKTQRLAVALCVGLLAAGCDLFELSPFEADVPLEQATRANLARLDALGLKPGAPFKLAVIADHHSDYTVLSNWVTRINQRDDITFVLHMGDQTDYGLKREHLWSRDVLRRLKVPYLTVIGNHDSLSSGPEIYRRLYGPLDYTLALGGVQFFIFNDNAWEFESGVPDYAWLDSQLKTAGTGLRFVCAHVPPFAGQMDPSDQQRYRALMRKHRVDLSLHGHLHHHVQGQPYQDGVTYTVVDDLPDRSFVIISVEGGSFRVSRSYF